MSYFSRRGSRPPSYVSTAPNEAEHETANVHHDAGLSSQLLPSTEPTVLSWPPSVPEDRLSSISNTAPLVRSWPPPVPEDENPPAYQTARQPTQSVTYSFSQLSHNSMILVPPMDAQDTRPVYHISVHLNCFMPSAARTIIRHGGTEGGDYVADFHTGIIATQATLFLRGNERPIGQHFPKTRGSHRAGIWKWKHGEREFFWDAELNERICYKSEDKSNPLAKFYPSDELRRRGHSAPESKLEVFPEGHEWFDDILLTALLLERQRLSPNREVQSVMAHSSVKPGILPLWSL